MMREARRKTSALRDSALTLHKDWEYSMAGHKNAECGKYPGITLSQAFGDGIEEELGAVRILFLFYFDNPFIG